MSLTIDYVTMPPKSQEVSQIQHSEQVKYDQSQHEAAAQFQHQVKQGSEQTVRRAKPENKEFRYEEKKHGGQGKKGNGRKNQKNGEPQEENKSSSLGESHFDMRI